MAATRLKKKPTGPARHQSGRVGACRCRELADATLALFNDRRAAMGRGVFEEPEMRSRAADARKRAGAGRRLPTPGTLLVERLQSAEGHHLIVHPFAGRNVHLGLASLLGWRLARNCEHLQHQHQRPTASSCWRLPVDIASGVRSAFATGTDLPTCWRA